MKIYVYKLKTILYNIFILKRGEVMKKIDVKIELTNELLKSLESLITKTDNIEVVIQDAIKYYCHNMGVYSKKDDKEI